MLSIRTIFLFLVVSNLFALLVISYNYYAIRTDEGLHRNTRVTQSHEPAFTAEPAKFLLQVRNKFDDPKLAFKIMTALDVSESLSPSFFNKEEVSKSLYDQPYLGLTLNDNDYCMKARQLFVEAPEVVFDDINVVMEPSGNSIIRSKVVPAIGNDIQPNIVGSSQRAISVHSLSPEANAFFTMSNMFQYRELGKQFSCLSQVSNHIPGHTYVTRPDLLADGIASHERRFGDRPACFSYSRLFTKTFQLNYQQQCKSFFEAIDTPEYRKLKKENGAAYVRKTLSANGTVEEIALVNDEEEANLRFAYEDGKKCGNLYVKNVLEAYVGNPLLINNKRFNIRAYMLIASTNPIVQYYHDGYLRVTEEDGIFVNKDGADEFVNAEYWTFERFAAYLADKGLVATHDWINSYFRSEMKKAMIDVSRSTSRNYFKSSSVYELYSMDFTMDDNLTLWFNEANYNIAQVTGNAEKDAFLTKMLKDHYEVVFGLLKSRMKRTVGYVNRLVKEKAVKESATGEVIITDLEQKIKEFQEITKNYFEPEFEPSKVNGFKKIQDENYFAIQRYNWIVDKDCLY